MIAPLLLSAFVAFAPIPTAASESPNGAQHHDAVQADAVHVDAVHVDAQRDTASDVQTSVSTDEPVPATAPGARVTMDHRGLRVRAADGQAGLDLTGFGQLAYSQLFDSPEGSTFTGFDIKALRPTVKLLLGAYADFVLTLHLSQSTVRAQNAILALHVHPRVRIQLGIQKPLLTLELKQSGRYILFLERSMVSWLTPSRDIGLVVDATPIDHLTLEVGVFNGANDGEVANGPRDEQLDFHARAIVSPLLADATGRARYLSLAIAGTTGMVRGNANAPQLRAYASYGKRPFVQFAPDAEGWGRRDRVALSAHGGWRGLHGQAEVLQETLGLRTSTATGRLRLRAWQIAVAQTFGGRTSMQGTLPTRDVFGGGVGALQIKARAHGFSAHDPRGRFLLVEGTPSAPLRYGTKMRALGTALGVSWFLSRALRIQADYSLTVFDEGESTPRQPTEHVIQLSTTFGL